MFLSSKLYHISRVNVKLDVMSDIFFLLYIRQYASKGKKFFSLKVLTDNRMKCYYAC